MYSSLLVYTPASSARFEYQFNYTHWDEKDNNGMVFVLYVCACVASKEPHVIDKLSQVFEAFRSVFRHGHQCESLKSAKKSSRDRDREIEIERERVE